MFQPHEDKEKPGCLILKPAFHPYFKTENEKRMTKSTRLCSDLKEGEKFEIAGLSMFFSYFVGNRHPLFTHEINGQTYGYYRTSWNKSTPVSEIK